MANKKVGLAVAIAAAIAIPAEGLRQYAYQDPVSIWTVCYGSTSGVVAGKRYTLDECKARLDRDMLHAVEQVDRCAPNAPPNVLAAFGDAAGEADSKAVRGEGDKRGRIEPKGSGRKHRDARVIQPGRTFASRNFTHLKVVYAALSEGTLGEFASNGIVQLSTNHPAVTKALGDRNVSTVAILACSVAAFSDASRARLSNILGIDPEQPDAPLQILSEFSRRIALSTGAAAPVAEAAE